MLSVLSDCVVFTVNIDNNFVNVIWHCKALRTAIYIGAIYKYHNLKYIEIWYIYVLIRAF
jgi:hypothetical protein